MQRLYSLFFAFDNLQIELLMFNLHEGSLSPL